MDSTIDKNYEKTREQGAKVFMDTGDTIIAEEWLQNTEEILDQIECKDEKRISYVVSLFKQDALNW